MHVVIFYFRLFIFHVFDKAVKKMLHAYTVALQNNCTISKVLKKHFHVWTGKQKNITVRRLVKYLMYQIPWKSGSKTDPSAIQMATRFFYIPRKKPAKKANPMFKNPASTTNRQPAANTSTNRQQNQICCTLSEHFTYTSRADSREGFICKE